MTHDIAVRERGCVMFDPEKVRRFAPMSSNEGLAEIPTGELVSSVDYDRLLEIYKAVCLELYTLRYVIGA